MPLDTRDFRHEDWHALFVVLLEQHGGEATIPVSARRRAKDDRRTVMFWPQVNGDLLAEVTADLSKAPTD